jgi:hypothetical protein
MKRGWIPLSDGAAEINAIVENSNHICGRKTRYINIFPMPQGIDNNEVTRNVQEMASTARPAK